MHIKFWTAGNAITLARVVVAFIAISFMGLGGIYAKLAFILIIAAIFMDWLDGYVAKACKKETRFGAVFDIIADRVVESTLWIFFAYMLLVPIWAPIIILTRDFIVDGLRSVALARGKTAFGKDTMMRSRLGYALAASPFSRGAYGFVKALTFCYVAFIYAFADSLRAYATTLSILSLVLVFITVAFCVVRGIAVVYESRHYME